MAGSKAFYFAPTLALVLGACNTNSNMLPEVHGHRGCRGLMPENTVPAFIKAVELGCDWIELDVVITGDDQVLVSHEPWMSHAICRTPQGDSITEARERNFNIYRMPLEQAQAFDCGMTAHPDFPEQEKLKASKPTLREVVEELDKRAMEEGLGNVNFNIEIKSESALYGTFQPRPDAFAKRVIEMVDSLNITDRCIIQSFDPAVLEAVHAINEEIPVALLVDNADGLEANLKRITFKPAYYSPSFSLVDEALVNALRERDIEPLVWTVNEEADMKRMIKLGVNGIITDYPDRLIALLDEE